MSSPVYSSPAFCYVRPADLNDVPQLAGVLAKSFYPPLGWQRWLHPILRFGIHEDIKQRLQSAQPHYRCFVAISPGVTTRQDQVVGTVEISCRRYRLWNFNQPQQVYLSNLAVREDWRRQGVAHQLLAASEQQATDWGFQELYLHVMADNGRALRLYEKMGYQMMQVETTILSLLNAQPQCLLLKKGLSLHPPSNRVQTLSPERSPS